MGRRQQCVQNADRQTNMPTQTKEIDRHAHTHAQTHTNTLFPPPTAVDFFNQINMLYGTIAEFCTAESCPVMSAGPKYVSLSLCLCVRLPASCLIW